MILAVAGPSGVGKSRLLELARSRCSYERPVAWTTRRRRIDEIDGRDYHFISREEFHQRIRDGQFLDWDFAIGHYYGYGRENERFLYTGAAVLAVTARVAVRLASRSPHVCSLFLDGDDDRMEARLEERGVDRPEQLMRQLHRSEERQHRPLFVEHEPRADVMADDEAAKLLDRLRDTYS